MTPKANKHSDELDGDEDLDICWGLQDSTTVFVNKEDVVEQLGNKDAYVPDIFLAKLIKLSSPKEQMREIDRQINNEKKDAETNRKISKEKNSKDKSDEKTKKNVSKDKVIEAVVKVIVINKKKQMSDSWKCDLVNSLLSEQQCYKGHVIIPCLLRRLMKLDVTSRVWLQVTEAAPVKPAKYELYPVGSVVSSVVEICHQCVTL